MTELSKDIDATKVKKNYLEDQRKIFEEYSKYTKDELIQVVKEKENILNRALKCLTHASEIANKEELIDILHLFSITKRSIDKCIIDITLSRVINLMDNEEKEGKRNANSKRKSRRK